MEVYINLHSRLETRLHAHPSNTRDVWLEMEVPAVGACHPTRAKTQKTPSVRPARAQHCLWDLAGWLGQAVPSVAAASHQERVMRVTFQKFMLFS